MTTTVRRATTLLFVVAGLALSWTGSSTSLSVAAVIAFISAALLAEGDQIRLGIAAACAVCATACALAGRREAEVLWVPAVVLAGVAIIRQAWALRPPMIGSTILRPMMTVPAIALVAVPFINLFHATSESLHDHGLALPGVFGIALPSTFAVESAASLLATIASPAPGPIDFFGRLIDVSGSVSGYAAATGVESALAAVLLGLTLRRVGVSSTVTVAISLAFGFGAFVFPLERAFFGPIWVAPAVILTWYTSSPSWLAVGLTVAVACANPIVWPLLLVIGITAPDTSLTRRLVVACGALVSAALHASGVGHRTAIESDGFAGQWALLSAVGSLTLFSLLTVRDRAAVKLACAALACLALIVVQRCAQSTPSTLDIGMLAGSRVDAILLVAAMTFVIAGAAVGYARNPRSLATGILASAAFVAALFGSRTTLSYEPDGELIRILRSCPGIRVAQLPMTRPESLDDFLFQYEARFANADPVALNDSLRALSVDDAQIAAVLNEQHVGAVRFQVAGFQSRASGDIIAPRRSFTNPRFSVAYAGVFSPTWLYVDASCNGIVHRR